MCVCVFVSVREWVNECVGKCVCLSLSVMLRVQRTPCRQHVRSCKPLVLGNMVPWQDEKRQHSISRASGLAVHEGMPTALPS